MLKYLSVLKQPSEMIAAKAEESPGSTGQDSG